MPNCIIQKSIKNSSRIFKPLSFLISHPTLLPFFFDRCCHFWEKGVSEVLINQLLDCYSFQPSVARQTKSVIDKVRAVTISGTQFQSAAKYLSKLKGMLALRYQYYFLAKHLSQLRHLFRGMIKQISKFINQGYVLIPKVQEKKTPSLPC